MEMNAKDDPEYLCMENGLCVQFLSLTFDLWGSVLRGTQGSSSKREAYGEFFLFSKGIQWR